MRDTRGSRGALGARPPGTSLRPKSSAARRRPPVAAVGSRLCPAAASAGGSPCWPDMVVVDDCLGWVGVAGESLQGRRGRWGRSLRPRGSLLRLQHTAGAPAALVGAERAEEGPGREAPLEGTQALTGSDAHALHGGRRLRCGI